MPRAVQHARQQGIFLLLGGKGGRIIFARSTAHRSVRYIPVLRRPAPQSPASAPAARHGPAASDSMHGRSFKISSRQAVVGQHSLQGGDLRRDIHRYIREQRIIQGVVGLIQRVKDGPRYRGGWSRRFTLLALHIVVGVQQLEGGGDIVFAKRRALGRLSGCASSQSQMAVVVVCIWSSSSRPCASCISCFFLLQHGGKAARRLKIERHIVCFFCRRFRLRRCLGGCGSFLRGTVILSSQVKLFRFFVHPCTQPAIADESAHPLEGTGLFLVHGFQRQALFAVKALLLPRPDGAASCWPSGGTHRQ